MEVIPASLSDTPNPVPDLRTRTFFIVNKKLDNEALRNALDQLVRTHWRKLGARLTWSRQTKQFEYRLPKDDFQPDDDLFKWSTEMNDWSIRKINELATLLSPGQNFAFLPSMDTIDGMLRPYEWPFERKDEPIDSPLLYFHLTNFSDATIIAMSCPHILADQSGVANIVKAWICVLEGKTPPAMMGYRDDVLARAVPSDRTLTKATRKGKMRVRSKLDMALVMAGIVHELIKNRKEESYIVFLPAQLIESLRQRTIKALEQEGESVPQISSGDIITAILTKVCYHREELIRGLYLTNWCSLYGYTKHLCLPLPFLKQLTVSYFGISGRQISQVSLVRGRTPVLPPDESDGFIHNALHYATSNFKISPTTPLREIVLLNRKAIQEALEPAAIEDGILALREISKSKQVMLICEPHQKLYSVSNWGATWQGIDFSSAVAEDQDMSQGRPELLVLGQSRTKKAPGRCEYIFFVAEKEHKLMRL